MNDENVTIIISLTRKTLHQSFPAGREIIGNFPSKFSTSMIDKQKFDRKSVQRTTNFCRIFFSMSYKFILKFMLEVFVKHEFFKLVTVFRRWKSALRKVFPNIDTPLFIFLRVRFSAKTVKFVYFFFQALLFQTLID